MKILNTISNKIKICFVLIIILIILLFSITFSISASNSYKINLNDGKPVIEEYSQNIKPGSEIEKVFFIENESDSKLDYRLYFEDVKGSLGKAVKATFYDENEVILSGYIDEINNLSSEDAIGTLEGNEKKYLKVVFTFPEEMENIYKNATLTFDIKAVAVWSR